MKRRKRLSPGEAKAAIYLDFEGEGLSDGVPRLPALAGYECQHTFAFCLLDPDLALFARSVRRSPWARQTLELNDFLEALLIKANEEGRLICFYSGHEQALIQHFAPPALAQAFAERAFNAKLMIQRWQKEKRGQRAEDGKLSSYAALERIETAPSPKGGVGEALRRLRAGAAGHSRLKQIRPSLRDLWDDLLLYNHNDVTTLRKLTVRAANYLANQKVSK